VARRQQQADRALRPAMPLAGPAVPCQARGARALAADRPWPAQRGRRAALPTVLDTVPAPRPATFSAPTAAARPPGPAPTASPGPSSPSRPPAGDARPPSTPRPSATSATPAKNGATTATPPAPESDSAAPAPHCQEPVTPHRPPRQPPGGPHAANLTPPEVGNFGEQSWGLSASGIRMRSPRSNRRVAAGESLRGGVVAVRPSTHCRPGGPSSLKTAKDVMDIVNACEATGTYRAAAVLAGTTHETVRRVMERQRADVVPASDTSPPRPWRRPSTAGSPTTAPIRPRHRHPFLRPRPRPGRRAGVRTLEATGSQLLFRFVAAASETTSLGVASHRPSRTEGQFLPDQSTAVSLDDRLLHHVTTSPPTARATACARPAARTGAAPRHDQLATQRGLRVGR